MRSHDEWERKLLASPVQKPEVYEEMRNNVRRAMRRRGHLIGARYSVLRSHFALAAATVAAVFIGAVGIHAVVSKPATSSGLASSHTQSSIQWSNADVKAIIQRVNKGHRVTNIKVIHKEVISDNGFAFASFNLDGKFKYANITKSRSQGTGIGIFTTGNDKRMPIQYNSQVTKNGYNHITGIVSNSNIRTVVVTFINGKVVDIPVIHSEFWFSGKIAKSGQKAYSKHAFGVTGNGSIVQNVQKSKK